MRAHRCASLLLLAALAATLAHEALAQTCGNIDALAAGRAAGNGVTNDAPALAKMDGDGAVGLIYLRRGRYRLTTSLNLRKPLMCDAGAVLQVDAGVTLTIQSQPECGLARMFDVKRERGSCGCRTGAVLSSAFSPVGHRTVDLPPAL